MKTKTFALLLVICIVSFSANYTVFAQENVKTNEDKVLLSSLEQEQCIMFLSDMGVTIPEELTGINIKKLVFDFEVEPNLRYVVNHTVAADFFEDVRSLVNSYYGRIANQEAKIARYSLQYSTLYSWNPTTMPNYNCYAYAIGRNLACDPGDFSGQFYDHTANIWSVADIVKDDLQGQLGYDCVKMQGTRPTSTSGWSNVIDVRKDTTGDYYGINDYHFSKLLSSNWYHKPGPTAILKFINPPSNSVAWTNEAYNGIYHAPSIWYESSNVYLLYKPNHGYVSYMWTGNHYHSGTRHYYEYGYKCQDCDEFTSTTWTSVSCPGPPCPL